MPGRCTSCSTCSATTWCCSSAAAPSAIRWASRPAPPPTASRSRPWCWRATRAATSATEGPEILRDAAAMVPAAARRARYVGRRHLRLHLDRHVRLRADRRRRLSRRTHGDFRCASPKVPSRSCPTSPTSRSRRRSSIASPGMGGERRVHRRSASPQHLLGDVGHADVRPARRRRRHGGGEAPAARPSPNVYVRVNAFDSTRGWETVRLSFIVQRPGRRAGLPPRRGSKAEGRTMRYAMRAYALDRPEGNRYGTATRDQRP